VKTVLTSGRSARLLQAGHVAPPLSRSLIVMVKVSSRLHLSQ